jgi:hypothetical protein
VSELSALTEKIDLLAKGVEGMAKGWNERFRLIERESSQAHRDILELHEQAEKSRHRRTVSTRVWLAAIAAAVTIVNGTFQVVGSSNRSSLRAEILNDVRGEQADRESRLADIAAQKAVEKHERQLALLIKGEPK